MSASKRYVYRFEINNYINTTYIVHVGRKLWPTHAHTSIFVDEFARLITYKHMAYGHWFLFTTTVPGAGIMKPLRLTKAGRSD